MNHIWKNVVVSLAFTSLPILPALAAEEPPAEWIEPATGHRVIRLSREPGSASLYFHQNPYTAEGDKLLITTPSGLSTVNLKTRALEVVVPPARYGMGGSSGLVVGPKSRQVYYGRRDGDQVVICAMHLDPKFTREIGKLPFFGSFGGVNADETLLIGAYNESRLCSPGGEREVSATCKLVPARNRLAPELQFGFGWTTVVCLVGTSFWLG
jgi:oligogalacturonide lyase